MTAEPAPSSHVNTTRAADDTKTPEKPGEGNPKPEKGLLWLIMAVATFGGATLATTLGLATATAVMADEKTYAAIFAACGAIGLKAPLLVVGITLLWTNKTMQEDTKRRNEQQQKRPPPARGRRRAAEHIDPNPPGPALRLRAVAEGYPQQLEVVEGDMLNLVGYAGLKPITGQVDKGQSGRAAQLGRDLASQPVAPEEKKPQSSHPTQLGRDLPRQRVEAEPEILQPLQPGKLRRYGTGQVVLPEIEQLQRHQPRRDRRVRRQGRIGTAGSGGRAGSGPPGQAAGPDRDRRAPGESGR